MRLYPNVWKLNELVEYVNENKISVSLSNGSYVPVRPLGWQSWHSALKAAWLVFTGKADAVIWPGQP